MSKTILLACFTVLICFPEEGRPAENSNLLLNPGFESDAISNGVPDHWVFRRKKGGGDICLDSLVKHSGLRSVRITHHDVNSYSQITLERAIPVDPESNYLLRGWVRTDFNTPLTAKDAEASMVKLFAYNHAGETLGGSPKIFGTLGQWQMIEIPFNSVKNKNLFIMGYLHHASGSVWFDDFELFKGDVSPAAVGSLRAAPAADGNIPQVYFTPGTIFNQKKFYLFKNDLSRMSAHYLGDAKETDKLELVIDAPPEVSIVADFLNAVVPKGQQTNKNDSILFRYTLPVPPKRVRSRFTEYSPHTLIFTAEQGFKDGAKLYYHLRRGETRSEEQAIELALVDWPSETGQQPQNFRVQTYQNFPLSGCPPDESFTPLFKRLAKTYFKAGLCGSMGFKTTNERIAWMRQNGWSFGSLSGFSGTASLLGFDSKADLHYAVNANGEKFRRNILCPTWCLEKNVMTSIAKAYANDSLRQGLPKDNFAWSIFDFEPHSKGWTECACQHCVRAFSKKIGAAYPAINSEKIKKEYQKEWKEFRNEQTASMILEFGKASKSALNDSLRFGICANPSMPWPPRVFDPHVDFHAPMIYYLHPASFFNVVQTETKRLGKPMLPTLSVTEAGISHWIAPEELKLMLLSCAVAGCQGAFLWTGTQSLGALSLVKIREAIDTIAVFEQYWLGGVKKDNMLSVTSSSSFYNYDVHQKGSDFLVSLFNFDAKNKLSLDVMLTGSLAGEYELIEPLSNTQLLSGERSGRIWAERDLKRGFSISVPPYEGRFLVLTPKSSGNETNNKTLLTPPSVSNQKKPDYTLKAAKISSPPIINGNIEEDTWRKEGKAGGFIARDRAATEQTEVFCSYDMDNLYLAVRCHESAIDSVKATCAKNSGSVWEDDCTEFFLQGNDPDIFYQIAVNPAGIINEKAGRMSNESGDYWASGAFAAAAVHRDRKCWEAEIRLPRQALKLDKLKPGAQIKFNVGRERKEYRSKAEENSSWVPCFGAFLPPKFGEIILEETGSDLKVPQY